MNTNRYLKEIERLIANAGMEILGIESNKHIKYTLKTAHGTRKLVCSMSPSQGDGALKVVARNLKHMNQGRA